MKSRIIILSFSFVIFIAITFLTSSKLYIRGGVDYYGFPLTFYTDHHDYWIPPEESTINYINLILDILLTTIFSFILYGFYKYIISWVVINFSRIPTLYFGIAYLSLIPLYAFIYFFMPNQFYQSTYITEKYNNGFEEKPDLQYEITNEIIEILSNNFIKYYGINYLISNSGDTLFYPIGSASMLEELVEVKGSNLTIPVSILTRKQYGKSLNLVMTLGDLNYSETIYKKDTVLRKMELDKTNLGDTTLVEMQLDYDINKLFPLNTYHSHREYGVLGSMFIKIDKKLQRKINSFVYGLNGYSFNKDFWNLLYLSTVTITTLGFGDIVPITRSSRLLVSSESILGVILIGLFLNALFRNNRYKSNYQKKLIEKRTNKHTQ